MSDLNQGLETVAAQPAESAPATEVNPSAAQSAATATAPEVATEPVAAEEPKEKKTVDVAEVIAQRKRRQEAEKEAAYLKGQVEALSRQLQPQQVAAPAVNPDVPPTPEEFETWEEFQAADREFLLAQAEKRVTARFQQQAAQVRQQTAQSAFAKRMDKAAEEDPSISVIVSDPTLPVHARALPIIHESDVAPQLLKFLDNDRKEAQRIYNLFNTNPILAVREMTKLELKLSSQPAPEPPKKVSLAPEPIKTVSAAGKTVIAEDDLPMDEWVKRRQKATGKVR